MRSLILTLGCFLVCCGSDAKPDPTPPDPTSPADTHESLAAEMLEVMDAYVSVLEKVTDAATAEAHRAEIEDYRARLGEFERRSEALGEMTPEQTAALTEKYGERMKALTQRQGQIGMRFGKDPAIRAALGLGAPEQPKSD